MASEPIQADLDGIFSPFMTNIHLPDFYNTVLKKNLSGKLLLKHGFPPLVSFPFFRQFKSK